jgi:hypothetical protein
MATRVNLAIEQEPAVPGQVCCRRTPSIQGRGSRGVSLKA